MNKAFEYWTPWIGSLTLENKSQRNNIQILRVTEGKK